MSSRPITLLLQDFAAGNKTALDQLMPLVYEELRKVAANKLNQERAAHTLQPTALVHEAYVKLINQDLADIHSRAHFFGVAAHLMRQILIDHARKRKTNKRGGAQIVCSLDESMDPAAERPTGAIALDDALQTLEQRDSFQAKLIEMRFFGGLTAEESAQVLDVPVQKVRAELRIAQAWLQRELDRDSISPK